MVSPTPSIVCQSLLNRLVRSGLQGLARCKGTVDGRFLDAILSSGESFCRIVGERREDGSREARMPTLSTMRLSRRWGTQFCYGLDLSRRSAAQPDSISMEEGSPVA